MFNIYLAAVLYQLTKINRVSLNSLLFSLKKLGWKFLSSKKYWLNLPVIMTELSTYISPDTMAHDFLISTAFVKQYQDFCDQLEDERDIRQAENIYKINNDFNSVVVFVFFLLKESFPF